MIEVEQPTQSDALTPERLQELANTPADDLTPAQRAEFDAAITGTAKPTETTEEAVEEEAKPEEPKPEENPNEPIVELEYNGETVQLTEQNILDAYEARRRYKELQADYTRKTQAIATERGQYKDLIGFIQNDPFVSKYMGMVFGGAEPETALEFVTKGLNQPEPQKFVIDEETGQKISNPDWLLWKMQGKKQLAPRTQQQPRQAENPISPVGMANGQIAISAIETIAEKYGLDISTQDKMDALTDRLDGVLKSRNVDYNTQPLTHKQMVQMFEQSNPSLVKKSQIAAEAKKQSSTKNAPITPKGGTANSPVVRRPLRADPTRELFA